MNQQSDVIGRFDKTLQALQQATEGTYVDKGHLLLTAAILTLAEAIHGTAK